MKQMKLGGFETLRGAFIGLLGGDYGKLIIPMVIFRLNRCNERDLKFLPNFKKSFVAIDKGMFQCLLTKTRFLATEPIIGKYILLRDVVK